MDTLIFLLLLSTLLAMRSQPRWLVLLLFLAAFATTLLLFQYHVTSSLPLNF